MTHAGRVDCIYIDPPYNTGNRDFVYNDRFVNPDDQWRHSRWLEFMWQRLTLARDLLAEHGVIFVSIDDHEIFHLGLLMNQVFGASQNLGLFVWRSRQSADARNKTGVSMDHEYVLCYGSKIRGTAVDETKFLNDDDDPRGPWRSADMTGLATRDQRPNLHYDLFDPESGRTYPCPPKGWRFEPKTMAKLIREKRVLWPTEATGRPRLKKFLNELSAKHKGFSTLLDSPLTSEGTKELKALGLGGMFSFPKPSGLIQQLIDQATRPDSLVLDFFAGSGTTAHAVLKLNAEDGGNRRCILVSSTEATVDEPTKNLCRDVCAERVRRVAGGYTPAGGEPVPGLGGDFAYLRARRLPRHKLAWRLAHQQVWTALQLMHFDDLLDAQSELGSLWIRESADAGGKRTRICYVAKHQSGIELKMEGLTAMVAEAVVYAWQPELLRQHASHPRLSIRPIPQTLMDRFAPAPRAGRTQPRPATP